MKSITYSKIEIKILECLWQYKVPLTCNQILPLLVSNYRKNPKAIENALNSLHVKKAIKIFNFKKGKANSSKKANSESAYMAVLTRDDYIESILINITNKFFPIIRTPRITNALSYLSDKNVDKLADELALYIKEYIKERKNSIEL